MNDAGSIQWRSDAEPASWIASQLHDFATDVGSVVPEGFEAYCRIFHPIDEGNGGFSGTWAELAAKNGRIAHAGMQLHKINRPPGVLPSGGYTMDQGPEWGSCPQSLREVLVVLLRPATATPNECIFCTWDGFGDLVGIDAQLHLPGRDYVMGIGPLESVLDDGLSRDQSPNLWWPADRAWVVATDIDYCWTYVGGSQELVDAITTCADLEAYRVSLRDRHFYDCDNLNSALDS